MNTANATCVHDRLNTKQVGQVLKTLKCTGERSVVGDRLFIDNETPKVFYSSEERLVEHRSTYSTAAKRHKNIGTIGRRERVFDTEV